MASDECHACAELSVEQQSLLSESVFMHGQHRLSVAVVIE